MDHEKGCCHREGNMIVLCVVLHYNVNDMEHPSRCSILSGNRCMLHVNGRLLVSCMCVHKGELAWHVIVLFHSGRANVARVGCRHHHRLGH
jgi:hypothetical protein